MKYKSWIYQHECIDYNDKNPICCEIYELNHKMKKNAQSRDRLHFYGQQINNYIDKINSSVLTNFVICAIKLDANHGWIDDIFYETINKLVSLEHIRFHPGCIVYLLLDYNSKYGKFMEIYKKNNKVLT